jgi:hypothetical protein
MRSFMTSARRTARVRTWTIRLAASPQPLAAKGAKPLAGGRRQVAPGGDAGDVAGEPDKQPEVLVTASCQALHAVEPPSPELRGGWYQALGEGVSVLDSPIVALCHRRPYEHPHPGI